MLPSCPRRHRSGSFTMGKEYFFTVEEVIAAGATISEVNYDCVEGSDSNESERVSGGLMPCQQLRSSSWREHVRASNS